MFAEIVIISGIVLAFVIFAAVLAWADYWTGNRRQARKAIAAPTRDVRAAFPGTPAGAAHS